MGLYFHFLRFLFLLVGLLCFSLPVLSKNSNGVEDFQQAGEKIKIQWGDTLSEIIHEHRRGQVRIWQELVPLYLSLNEQIVNPDLIYAGQYIYVPSRKEVAAFLQTPEGRKLSSLEGVSETELDQDTGVAFLEQQYKWEWSMGLLPFISQDISADGAGSVKLVSDGGYDAFLGLRHRFNEDYSLGFFYEYAKKEFLSSDTARTPYTFSLNSLYLRGFKNWQSFVFSVLVGKKERIVHSPSFTSVFEKDSHFDYGIGIHYWLLNSPKFSSLIGVEWFGYTDGSDVNSQNSHSGYGLNGLISVQYHLLGTYLLALDMSYLLERGENSTHEHAVEEFLPRLRMQLNF